MVKLKVEWSTDAKSDLFDILDFYVERNKNAIYSKKLNADIDDSVKLLSQYPSLGLLTDYDSVRALITKDYQVIYETYEQILLVIMIWDCRKDPNDKRIGRRIR